MTKKSLYMSRVDTTIVGLTQTDQQHITLFIQIFSI